MERKRLVIDANILIRGCLGVRVRTLIADYADRVDFFVAEANVAEAAPLHLRSRQGKEPR